MKRKHIFYFLIVFFLCTPPLQAQRLEELSQEELLERLDKSVASRKAYRSMLIAHLDSIGRNAHHLTGMPRAEA